MTLLAYYSSIEPKINLNILAENCIEWIALVFPSHDHQLDKWTNKSAYTFQAFEIEFFIETTVTQNVFENVSLPTACNFVSFRKCPGQNYTGYIYYFVYEFSNSV